MPKNIFTPEVEGTKGRGKTQERMERVSRKKSSHAGSENMEKVGAGWKKWKDIFRQAKAHSWL